jgi:hypothetical protein
LAVREGPQPYTIGSGTLLLTVAGSDLGGGGLTAGDPLTLFRPGGRDPAAVASTFGTPVDAAEALDRDDDGLDALPFDPGDGRSLERVLPAEEDRESNWRRSPPGGTPGGHNAATPFALDAAISAGSMRVEPVLPRPLSAAQVVVSVSNAGELESPAGELTLLSVAFGDTARITTVPTPPLAAAENVDLRLQWEVVPAGVNWLGAELQTPGDQNAANDRAWRRVGLSVVINEVMANPSGGENEIPGGDADEWVELYNASARAIDLAGWMLTDGDGLDSLCAWSEARLPAPDLRCGATLLDPGAFALILDPDYVARGARQPYSIPPGTLILALGDHEFGSGGLSNGEPLTLYAAGPLGCGQVVSTFGLPRAAEDPFDRDAALEGFPGDAGDGCSWERMDPASPDGPGAWGKALGLPTPGAVNSITPVARDLAIDSLLIENSSPGGRVGLRTVIAAAGTLAVAGEQLRWTDEFGELERNVDLPEMGRGERLEVRTEETLAAGRHRIWAEIGNDDRGSNNRRHVDLIVGDVAPTLVINEFMCRPDPSRGGCEWIELYNASAERIDLRGWRIGDEQQSSFLVDRDDAALFVAPAAFVVIAQDAAKMRHSWPDLTGPILEPEHWATLNQSSDLIVLLDATGFAVERVAYEPGWLGRRSAEEGVSWERVDATERCDDSRNWWLSVATPGATPAAENSLASGFSRRIDLKVEPNPFSPDGDGFADLATIHYRLPPKSLLTLRVFDAAGYRVRTLVDGEGRSDGVAFWDGCDDRGRRLPVGIYVVLARASGEKLQSSKCTLVLAEPLR